MLPSLIRPMRALVPGFADPWITAMARYPITPMVLAVTIWVLLKWSGSLERRLWDRSYQLWRSLLNGQPIDNADESGVREFREGPTYQNIFKAVKWSVLPAVFGISMLLAFLYIPAVGITQAVIQIHNSRPLFLPGRRSKAASQGRRSRDDRVRYK